MPFPVEDYAYDEEGNCTSRTSRATGAVETYSYDSQNRLTGYTDGTTTANYAYDALGRRIARTVDATSIEYVYGVFGQQDIDLDPIVLEFSNRQLTRRWLEDTGIDRPLSFEVYEIDTTPGSGQTFSLFADRTGNVDWVFDEAAGQIAVAYEYDAYGQRTGTTSFDQAYGFTGREHDPESGLIFFRARYYDPGTGTFVQSDPVEFESGGFGLYGYVSADPYNFTDPSGLTKGSIRNPNTSPGTSTLEKDIIDYGMAAMRDEAVEAIAGAALDLLLKTMAEANGWAVRGPLSIDKHHCLPRAYGGKGGPNLKDIRRIRHVYVHKLMNVYMGKFRKLNATMATKRGKPGAVVAQFFTQDEMKAIVRQFYRDMDAVLGVKAGTKGGGFCP